MCMVFQSVLKPKRPGRQQSGHPSHPHALPFMHAYSHPAHTLHCAIQGYAYTFYLAYAHRDTISGNGLHSYAYSS